MGRAMDLRPHTPRDPNAPDIAADPRATVAGPHPLVRAVVGVACGIVAGGLAALLTPRSDRQRDVFGERRG